MTTSRNRNVFRHLCELTGWPRDRRKRRILDAGPGVSSGVRAGHDLVRTDAAPRRSGFECGATMLTDRPQHSGPGGDGGGGDGAVYLLVWGQDSGVGAGWALETWHGHRRGRSTGLACRGAAPGAGPRVAQAVAVRVLAEQGVAVQGWGPGGGEQGQVFLAWLNAPARARGRRHPALWPRWAHPRVEQRHARLRTEHDRTDADS